MTKEKTNPNKNIWDKLKQTDPRFTKRVNKGFGEITTIDPMYQIMKMTETFGPIGKGWSYDAEYKYQGTDNNQTAVVFAEVKIVYRIEDIWYRYGPVSSVCALYKKAGSLDDEAPKKALTDAMTKAFSHLGVSADVFLGLFDNNKYVQTMKEKFNGKAAAEGVKAKVVQINKNNKEKNDK